MLDRRRELVHRYLDRLDRADDVGELKADEAQVLLFGELEGSGLILDGHGWIPLRAVVDRWSEA
jgi:hypothetical protein